jgi:hypothetical protein
MDIKKMKRILGMIMMCVLLAVMPAGCSASKGEAVTDTGEAGNMQSAESEENAALEEEEIVEMKMSINGTAVDVDWEDNESVAALRDLASEKPLTIRMSMYGGFEQVGPIGSDLPSNDVQTTTSAGDIVLYSGNQIVVFYGSNSWAYTRLGHISDQDTAGMRDLLGSGDVTITISMENK